jgi:hypothetical protein
VLISKFFLSHGADIIGVSLLWVRCGDDLGMSSRAAQLFFLSIMSYDINEVLGNIVFDE